jgi:MFS transporter, PPP family, 3-phenylpropionic acid transporter
MKTVDSRSPLVIIGIQYFLYFGVVGVFLPYFNLYCHHIGLDGFQIGSLSAIRAISFSFFPLIWSHLADRFGMRRGIYILCNLFSVLIWTFFFFTTDFSAMLIISLCYGIFFSPLLSFLETATLEQLIRRKSHYGRIRVWGSISFIIAVLGTGKLTDYFSTRLILYFICLGSLFQGGLSLGLPISNTTLPTHHTEKHPPLFTRQVLIFLLCGFLMQISHGTYYGFFSIHLEALGCSKALIGIAWSLATAAEIIVMFNSGKFFKRFHLEAVIFFSFMIAVLRWLVLYLSTSPAVILLVQITHAFTYGAFHMANVLYMDRLSPAQSKTTGQAAYNAVNYGMGMMVSFFLNGVLYEAMGAQTLFLMSAGVALTGGILFKIFFRSPKRLSPI